MASAAPAANVVDLSEIDDMIRAGRLARARERLNDLEPDLPDEAEAVRQVAERYLASQGFAEASRMYERAVTLNPNDALLWHSRAASLLSFGDKKGAEEAIDRAIEVDPTLYNAWYFRSTIRKQTPDNNHVDALEAALAKAPARAPAQAAFCYALAKELEDLGDYERAFSYLERGAKVRRAGMSYNVGSDIAIMGEIARKFDSGWRSAAGPGAAADDAIFVMGLPRSGTTLVESILSAHSKVESKGEITDFAMAIMDLAGPVRTPADLLSATAQMNMAQLGERFLSRVAAQGRAAARFVDKTPHNYLYIGLIDAALPNASVIHLQRHPMDSCYALYKTWFNMAAPFSYSLDDLARYYVAYHQLIEHWRSLNPSCVLEVSYEDLVSNQRRVSETMVAHCGLEWEEQCINFNKASAPVATASASQVRSPIYKSSVALWRRYERQLQPLADALSAAGVCIE